MYPNGIFSSNLIGVATSQTNKKTGTSNLVGQMGIEKAFNKTLAGQNGYKDAQYDVYGYKLPGKRQKEKAVKNGNNIYTTIDSRIQTLLESEMNSVQSQVHPAGMNAVLMDAKTGKIVAASQRPTFNASTMKGIGSAWTNTLSSDMYEPGSTMKVFTLSAAINSGHYNGNDTYEIRALFQSMARSCRIGILVVGVILPTTKDLPFPVTLLWPTWSNKLGPKYLEKSIFQKVFGFLNVKQPTRAFPNEFKPVGFKVLNYPI